LRSLLLVFTFSCPHGVVLHTYRGYSSYEVTDTTSRDHGGKLRSSALAGYLHHIAASSLPSRNGIRDYPGTSVQSLIHLPDLDPRELLESCGPDAKIGRVLRYLPAKLEASPIALERQPEPGLQDSDLALYHSVRPLHSISGSFHMRTAPMKVPARGPHKQPSTPSAMGSCRLYPISPTSPHLTSPQHSPRYPALTSLPCVQEYHV
jgi:hypothetical protein